MNEAKIRETLAAIDQRRADADVCAQMHTHWMDFDGYLEEDVQVTVRRRWCSDKRVSSRREMSRTEIHLFLDWLQLRAGQLRMEADKLSESILSPERGEG